MFIYRTLKPKEIWTIIVESLRTYTPILFILAASTAFSRILTLMHVPQMVSEAIINNFHSPAAILLIINLFLLIVGMVMDTTPAILILTPILLPIAAAIGMSPIQFGVIIVANLAIGFVTPPIGVNLFVASSLTNVPIMQISKKVMPMIALFLAALLLITFIPAISLALLQEETMKRKSVFALFLCLFFGCSSLISGCSSSEQTFAWPLATASAEDTVTQLFAVKFAEEVSRLSGGQMKIEVYPNSTLGGDRDLLESCADGDIPFIVQNTAPQITFMPDLAVFDLPCAYSSLEELRAAVDNPQLYEPISAVYTEAGYHLLGIADQGFRVMSTNKEVEELADFKGQKIRTMENPCHLSFWSSLGAAPTPMSFSEVYIGLQQHTIDAQENPYEVIVSNRLYEQQDYVVETNHLPHLITLIVNDEFYQNFDEEQKAILDEAAAIATEYARQMSDECISLKISEIEESGTQIIQLDESVHEQMREASSGLYETIKSKVDSDIYNAYASGS